MNPEESSISIINRNNGNVSGESAGALPIKWVTNNTAWKFFTFGFTSCLIFFILLIVVVKRQVIVVDTTGVSAEFVEYQLK